MSYFLFYSILLATLYANGYGKENLNLYFSPNFKNSELHSKEKNTEIFSNIEDIFNLVQTNQKQNYEISFLEANEELIKGKKMDISNRNIIFKYFFRKFYELIKNSSDNKAKICFFKTIWRIKNNGLIKISNFHIKQQYSSFQVNHGTLIFEVKGFKFLFYLYIGL